MPQYSFGCSSCKKKFEFRWSFSEYDLKKNNTDCPTCGTKLERLIDKNHFKLVGYGWYKPNEFTQGIDPYSISDSEIAKNEDDTKRADDMIQNMSAKQVDEGE